MLKSYRTYANDDLSVVAWVSHDTDRNRYVVNSRSPWHNPSQNGTTYPDAYRAVCAAKDVFDRLSAEAAKV